MFYSTQISNYIVTQIRILSVWAGSVEKLCRPNLASNSLFLFFKVLCIPNCNCHEAHFYKCADSTLRISYREQFWSVEIIIEVILYSIFVHNQVTLLIGKKNVGIKGMISKLDTDLFAQIKNQVKLLQKITLKTSLRYKWNCILLLNLNSTFF